MKIRLLSDLHLEFGDYLVEPTTDDKNTVLVLAGDITVASSRYVMDELFVPFIRNCSQQFKAVVMVCGNHEYYGSDFHTVVPTIKKAIDSAMVSDWCNVHLLDNESVTIDDTIFVGGTLWTNCGNNDPRSYYHWHGMSDYTQISYNGHRFLVADVIAEHEKTSNYILNELEKANRNIVMVVHHGVSIKGVHSQYKGSTMNKFFYTDMDLELAEVNPNLVLHGHTHNAVDYMLDDVICNTRVVCNPRGYHGYESPPESRGFNPTLLLEI